MSQQDHTDGVTYRVTTRDGSEEHVVSTIEKYYGELLVDITPNRAGGLLVITTRYELPSDAFRRITEVEDVVAHTDGERGETG